MEGNESPRRIFYHGSSVQGIRLLKPFSKSHNTIKKPVVYLTPNETLALFYIWEREYKFVTFDEDERGAVVYTEWYENQFDDLTRGLSGSVYACLDDPRIYATHVKGVFNSDEPVPVLSETVIDDVQGEIRKRIADGRVVLRPYRTLDEEEKEKIKDNVVRAIHLQHLLAPGESAYKTFLQERFPVSWNIAANMSAPEIKAMIDEWRRAN